MIKAVSFKRYAKSVGALVFGLLVAAFLPADAFKGVTQELVGLFGLLIAAVLPAMVLTAGALRAGNLSLKRLLAYQSALHVQMKVWAGLFLICLVASFVVIMGGVFDWTLPVNIALERWNIPRISFDAIRALNAVIGACLALLMIRAPTVVRGLMSLSTLTAETAISEAKVRDETRHSEADEAISKMESRPEFGKYVDLPH